MRQFQFVNKQALVPSSLFDVGSLCCIIIPLHLCGETVYKIQSTKTVDKKIHISFQCVRRVFLV